MRTILVPFCDDDRAEAALRTALLVAKRYASHVEGLHAWRTPQIIAGEGVVFPSESLARLTDESKQFAASAHQRFDRVVKVADIPYRDIGTASDSASCSWREGEGVESEIVGDYGRLFNLIVMGRSESGTSVDWKATLEAGLFESGRPILLTPSAVPESLGKHVVIAWNGATETVRTMAVAMPFVRDAERVTVLTVEGGFVPGPSAEDVARHLTRNGVETTTMTAAPGRRSIGETMVEEAAKAGGDLLLKGAFTNSRLRQMIFGGATRDIIGSSSLPVLLAR
ncbi:MAG: universal stress protein [Alphaproteobacteria bacterium]|jgi:nucleotide-binding universal stress UspA family protein|nr:universal stress protein [Alphaproteobacteria bacterium]MDP7228736.1 universal stress protein [Alphaproteobacteria bacterium]MDP7461408.1 universal stress protein [Alphaproteobacteria bacterium]HJM92767.1 universal stress protein [Alphaproteobacteria bacterium]|tara:strand:+ start:3220 stop:4065 length:846 start_codon:yes stop_codon:yes gene_type:complete